jgi:hypothetical protein
LKFKIATFALLFTSTCGVRQNIWLKNPTVMEKTKHALVFDENIKFGLEKNVSITTLMGRPLVRVSVQLYTSV